MKKLSLPQEVRRKEQIKQYREGVENQHSLFGGSVVEAIKNTPDRIQFGGRYEFHDSNAYPFEYVHIDNETKIFYGEPGATHGVIRRGQTSDYIKNNYGDNAYTDVIYGVHDRFLIDGRYYLVDFDAIPKECVVFTFWGPNIHLINEEPNIDLINEIVYEICKEKHFFNKEIFIANGRSPMIHWNEFTPGDAEIENNSTEHAMHLMSAKDKHDATSDFRKTRDELQGKKLGNMTQAEWNNMKYGYVAENTVLMRRFINEAGITELATLPNKFYESVERYYNNGELTSSNNKFIPKTCHRLNEILKYIANTNSGEFEDLTLRELFKRYGKIVEQYKLKKPILKEGFNHNFDAAARTHFSISGEKLDRYCHVIDEIIDEMNSSFNTNRILTKESIDELCSDTEVKDVMSSFDVQKYLNEKFWDENNHLNPRVRMRLLDIADKFYETLETSWVEPVDVIFTGSLCNYNWSKYSDVDLHIVVDFDDVDKRTNFVKDYFDTKKKEWNNEHENLTIYGFPVELYVQDSKEEHTASGIYSLYKDKWIVEPNPDNFTAKDLDKKTIASKVMKCADKIDELEELANKETDEHKIETIGLKAKKLFTKIKSLRKHGLKNGGEMAPGNLLFKSLRRLGYIGKLIELKAKTFDKMHTIK